MIGKQIAHYEITQKLGEGSMGEVYRARDTRLNRDVALKVLPASFSEDPKRMARFEREAQVLASLSHPNVAGIYGFEEADGIRCLVLELIEGGSLTDRLGEGSLSLKETLEIASQVAAALEATHEKGIIHRDLNPANIKILDNGTVKVLDFGLAKVFMDDTEAPVALSTQAGVLLGTPAYMSPEQVRGRGVDNRTDVWAFGCVVFEMLTGTHAFLKETVPDTLAAVMDHDPEWNLLRADTPPALRRLLQRCLNKDPQRRLRHIGDAALEIEEAVREAAGAGSSTAGAGTPAGWRMVATVGVIGLVIGALVGSVVRNPALVAPENTGGTILQLTNDSLVEAWPSFSPDGRSVVYASNASGNWDIYRQRVGGRNAINLTEDSDADDESPVLSPDGERIAFHSDRDGTKGIFLMGATGESVRRLTDDEGFNPAWSPDSSRIVYGKGEAITFNPTGRVVVGAELWIVDLDQPEPQRLETGRDAVQPNWSRNGYRIAFWGLAAGSGQRDIWTIPAEGGVAVAVTQDVYVDWNPVWSPDGRYLYFSSDRAGGMNIWRVPIDEESGTVLGLPEQMTTGGSTQHMHLALSQSNDQLAYAERRTSTNLFRMGFDPANGTVTGDPRAITGGSRNVTAPDVSSDGQWLTYSLRGSKEEIIVSRVDGSDIRQLTDDEFRNRGPRWSPDDNRIAFYSDRSGSYEIWSMNPDGSSLKQETDSPASEITPVWSPDGTRLIYSTSQEAHILDMEARTTELLPDAPPRWSVGSWSTGGSMLAGSFDNLLSIYSLESMSVIHAVPGANSGRWVDDNTLVYRFGNQVRLLDTASGDDRNLYTAGIDVTMSIAGFSPDRRTLYLTMSSPPESDIWLLTLP